jgi:hypothetical protein
MDITIGTRKYFIKRLELFHKPTGDSSANGNPRRKKRTSGLNSFSERKFEVFFRE